MYIFFVNSLVRVTIRSSHLGLNHNIIQYNEGPLHDISLKSDFESIKNSYKRNSKACIYL